MKAYGLRILFRADGYGRKFDLSRTLRTIGACIGLLSISIMIAELYIRCCIEKSENPNSVNKKKPLCYVIRF
jgi:hypothetical protein